MPFRLGELLRARSLGRQTGLPISSCLGAAVVERALDLLWLTLFVLLFPALLAFDPSRRTGLAWMALALGLGMAASPWLGRLAVAGLGRFLRWTRLGGDGFSGRLSRAIEAFLTGVTTVRSPRRFLVASSWTLGYWVCGVVSIGLWLVAFDLRLPWHAAPLVLVFVALGVALPAAPGFLGTYHVAVVAALRLFDVPIDRAVAVAIVGHFVATVPAALVALPLLVAELRRTRRPTPEEPRSDG